MSYPRVTWQGTHYGRGEISYLALDTGDTIILREGIVVPLGSLVIERDENGKWPAPLVALVEEFVTERQTPWAGVSAAELLDALAATDALAEGETQ